jgi:hypothetical protein
VTAQPYFQPKFITNHLGAKLVNMSTDTFQFGLIASGPLASRPTADGYEFVSDLLANGGSALTEVSTSGTAYTRQALTSVSWGLSALVVTFTAANLSWPAATFSTVYGWIHDETASSGTDATRPLVTIFDFGGAQPVSASTFTLTVNASGLATLTAAQ